MVTRLREKPRRRKDDFGPGRDAKRLGNGIDAGQRAFHCSHFERVGGHFFCLAIFAVIRRALAAGRGH